MANSYKMIRSPVSTLKTETDVSARLKNSLARTVKADITLGSLPDHDDYDEEARMRMDDVDEGGGEDEAYRPVSLFRASQSQLSPQACRLLLCLACLQQHFISNHHTIMVFFAWTGSPA